MKHNDNTNATTNNNDTDTNTMMENYSKCYERHQNLAFDQKYVFRSVWAENLGARVSRPGDLENAVRSESPLAEGRPAGGVRGGGAIRPELAGWAGADLEMRITVRLGHDEA